MKTPPQAAIYILLHKSGTLYIGATVDYAHRKSQHFGDLKRGIHHSKSLQEDYDRDGLSSVNFGIVQYVENPAELPYLEQKTINDFIDQGHTLYNTHLIQHKDPKFKMSKIPKRMIPLSVQLERQQKAQNV